MGKSISLSSFRGVPLLFSMLELWQNLSTAPSDLLLHRTTSSAIYMKVNLDSVSPQSGDATNFTSNSLSSSSNSSATFRFHSNLSTCPTIKVRSVNYFISRRCNYACKFCFHTNKNSHILSLSSAKHGLKLLRDAGCEKINFAGGEPFLHEAYLGALCKHAHALGMAVSIISNGSLITSAWMDTYAKYLDILGLSVDSFNDDVNTFIGRSTTINNSTSTTNLKLKENETKSSHLDHLQRVRQLCHKHSILFKLNTVVCTANMDEDMSVHIRKLNPYRWKVFQCLVLQGENGGSDTDIRDATHMTVNRQQFNAFVDRHEGEFGSVLVPEPTDVMRDSYLMLDEEMRFLDCSGDGKVAGASILDVGVEKAVQMSGFDDIMFEKRGGVYEWSRAKDGGKKNKREEKEEENAGMVDCVAEKEEQNGC